MTDDFCFPKMVKGESSGGKLVGALTDVDDSQENTDAGKKIEKAAALNAFLLHF